MTHRSFLTTVFCLLMLTGCGGDAPYRKPTSPLKGKITVDDKEPGSGIQISCHPVAGMDEQHPSVTTAESNPDGTFSLSTYESGDGIPAGEYILLFSWQEFNVMSRNYSGKDKLNGRYADPSKSPIKVTVKEGEENDMGTIQLTTK
ncbi:MAG: hypothetical protein ACK58L_13065 [Planctomycetota bacterium]